jgi:hypothetical protein
MGVNALEGQPMVTTPYFEIHIRPMFRMIDRDHMLFKFDLWDYDCIKTHSPDISRFLQPAPPGPMPTKAAGGPWPTGWIETFDLWISLGCPRLSLAQGQYTAKRLGDGKIMLRGTLPLANGAADAWLDRNPSAETVAGYVAYLRPAPDNVVDPPRNAAIMEVLPPTITSIVITDSAGQHSIPIL